MAGGLLARLLWGRDPERARTRIPVPIRRFSTTERTIGGDIRVDGDAWLIDSMEPRIARLFEVADPQVDNCLLTYRAALRSQNFSGRVYLEMWCRLPGLGEFFSRGVKRTLSGTTEWSSFEIPFRLKMGQQPDLIKLNLGVEGYGKVWIKDIELLRSSN